MLTFCAMDCTSHEVSSRAGFMAHFFTLFAQERKYLVQVPGAPLKEVWLLMGSAKLKLNPRASRNVCAQRSSSAQYIWGQKYDQFSRFKSAYTNLSSTDCSPVGLSVVLTHSQWQLALPRIYPVWLKPGLSAKLWRPPDTAHVHKATLHCVQNYVQPCSATAPIPSAPRLSMPLSSHSSGPWHGSATLQPPEDKLTDWFPGILWGLASEGFKRDSALVVCVYYMEGVLWTRKSRSDFSAVVVSCKPGTQDF